MKARPREPARYLGLELSGAKNPKTALAALEYYPREHKVFLLDVFERISGRGDGSGGKAAQTGDEALLEVLRELTEEHEPGTIHLGVNVPLTLPPCAECTRKTCPMPRSCTVPTVKWMRSNARRHSKSLDFTPYTQRPAELWIKHHVLEALPESHRFEIDEALGGNKAPLTMRMHFLRRHLPDLKIIEAWPKLTVAVLAHELGLSKRVVQGYRNLEEGAHAREEILEALAEKKGIFIYERDLTKLSTTLASFDAFICAFTALLSDTGLCEAVPTGFPEAAGWVEYPTPETLG
jgi:hypothetical protein